MALIPAFIHVTFTLHTATRAVSNKSRTAWFLPFIKRYHRYQVVAPTQLFYLVRQWYPPIHNLFVWYNQVSLMVIALWFTAWTPYLIINYSGIFELVPLSPLGTVCGAVFSKANAVYNPIVYAIRYEHPAVRVFTYKVD